MHFPSFRPLRIAFQPIFRLGIGLITAATCISSAVAGSQAFQPLHVPQLEAIGRSNLVGPAPANKVLHLCVCLKMPDPDALQRFVDDVSSPSSANYRKFLSPSELGEKFGQSPAAVGAVVRYLRQQGFQMELLAKDNLHILAKGTVAQAEAAFHTRINQFHSLSAKEYGHVDFIANATPPEMPTELASIVEDVEGLQTWNKGFPLTTLSPAQTSVLYNTAPLIHADRRILGQGRTIGISSWDGFSLSNVALFIKQYGLPVPPAGALSNVSVRSIDGGSETTQYPLGEGDLDPQMVIGQAPLAKIIIYDGAGGGDTATDQQVLNVYVREEDEDAVDLITESYGWTLGTPSAIAAHNVHLLMNAEGITYMAATGDSQSQWEQDIWYSTCEPEVLLVGGTSAEVDPVGNRKSEVVWQDGSGGWPTIDLPFNRRPSWLKGKGVPMQYNFRLNPDVSAHASGDFNSTEGAYYFYYNGSITGGYIGTSFACPIFAGGLAVAEQELINLAKVRKDKNGHYRLGRIQDLIYSQNGNPSVWYDITKGNNGVLPNGYPSNASLGWDTCTGWGVINWDGFVKAFPYPAR